MSIRFCKRNRKRIPINVCALKVKRKCVVKLFYGPSLDTHWHVMFFNFSFIDFYGMSRFGHTFGPVDCQRTILRCFILLCPVKRTCAFYDIFSKSKPILSPLHGPITWQKCEQVRLNVFLGGWESFAYLVDNKPTFGCYNLVEERYQCLRHVSFTSCQCCANMRVCFFAI